MNVLMDYFGKMSMLSFQETMLKAGLSKKNSSHTSFSMQGKMEWGSDLDLGNLNSGADPELILAFDLTIVRALNLTKTDVVGSADPFIELYWKGSKQVIGKTKVIKDSLTPEWNETFKLLNTSHLKKEKKALVLEMYDMQTFGKGAFMGQVELPYDSICSESGGEVELPFTLKQGLTAKKQKMVGGSVVMWGVGPV